MSGFLNYSSVSQYEEDPSTLQLAWEMLELAKVIYNKQVDDTKDDSSTKANYEKKLCETFLTLGEVSIENKNYPQAVDNFSACLKKSSMVSSTCLL